ncbi:hypothetical protein JCM19992_19320 [Thermostilla marina]
MRTWLRNHVIRLTIFWGVTCVFSAVTLGADFFVAPDGSDQNPGTYARPFATIQHGINTLRAGDTLYLRGGRYRKQVVINGVAGTAAAPIRVRNFPGETPVIDGTEPIAELATSDWRHEADGVYSINLSQSVWQLFLDGSPAQPARFPDAFLSDGSVWDMRTAMLEPDEVTVTHLRSSALADSGKDFTGAVAVLAVGHWLTYARPVLFHERGGAEIRYASRLPGGGGQEVTLKPHRFFYLLGKACLDHENEWWFDASTKTLSLWTPGGKQPSQAGEITGRVRDYGLVVQSARHVQMSGIEFFACAPFVDNSANIAFADCRFRYPSENKFLLGRYEWFSPAKSGPNHPGNNMFLLRNGHDYAMTNCIVEFCNSPVGLLADGIRVENCLFHDIEWDVTSSGGSGSVWIGSGAKALRNTIHTCGNSEGLRPVGPRAEIAWNHVYHMGLLQIDGAAINCGMHSHRGLAVHHNWVHDCNREAIRFDYADVDGLDPDGQAGTLCFNVMWNCQLPMVKGDRNLVYHNVSFGHHKHGEFGGGSLADIRDLVILGFRKIHRNVLFNEHTLVCNNIARLGYFINGDELPCREDHNLNVPRAATNVLRDPVNWDFRPKPGAVIIDAGRLLSPKDRPDRDTPFVPPTYLGEAPDIGAYEYGDERYWIPGRQDTCASTPVPPDGSIGVQPDADLMFLAARGVGQHVVYFGTSPEAMTKRTMLNDTNMFRPGPLKPGQTYYWRVDGIRDGKTIPGPVWKFTVGVR